MVPTRATNKQEPERQVAANKMSGSRRNWCDYIFARFFPLALGLAVFECELRMDKLREIIDPNDAAQARQLDTVVELASMVEFNRRFRYVIKVLLFVFAVRAVTYCSIMHFEYGAFSSGVELQISLDEVSGQLVYDYACLRSNCTAIFDPQISGIRSEETPVADLPVFGICHPTLSRFNEPFQHTNQLALLYYTGVICFSMVLTFPFDFQAVGGHMRHSLLLFLVAPDVSRRLHVFKASKCARQLDESLANFRRLASRNQEPRTPIGRATNLRGPFLHRPSIRIDMLDQAGPGPLFEDQEGACSALADESDVKLAAQSGHHLDRGRLPLIRLDWWHRCAHRFASLILVCTFSLVLIFPITNHFRMSNLFDTQSAQMRELQQEMGRSGCALWYRNQSPPNTVKLESVHLGFTLYSYFNLYAIIGLWPASITVFLIGCSVLIAWDARCMIFEIKYKLITLRPLIINETNSSFEPPDQSFDRPQAFSKYDSYVNTRGATAARKDAARHRINGLMFSKLMQKFTKDVQASTLLLGFNSLLKLEVQIENQAYVIGECFEHQGSPYEWSEVLCDILEELYVEFRLLEGLRREVEPIISLFVGLFTIINYWAALITLLCYRRSKTLYLETYVLTMNSYTIPSILILNSAILQSKFHELPSLIWPLLAQASRIRSTRLQHMRLLWLKMIIMYEGRSKSGDFNIFRANYTYVSLIQIFIGTSTLLVAILRL